MPFSSFKLSPDLLRGVAAMGFAAPTPIQQQAIPAALDPGTVLRVALARRLPRDVDRGGLVDRVDELAPGALLRSTLPMAHPGVATRSGTLAHSGRRAAVLYAPGSAASRAYLALAAELMRDLGELDM